MVLPIVSLECTTFAHSENTKINPNSPLANCAVVVSTKINLVSRRAKTVHFLLTVRRVDRVHRIVLVCTDTDSRADVVIPERDGITSQQMHWCVSWQEKTIGQALMIFDKWITSIDKKITHILNHMHQAVTCIEIVIQADVYSGLTVPLATLLAVKPSIYVCVLLRVNRVHIKIKNMYLCRTSVKLVLLVVTVLRVPRIVHIPRQVVLLVRSQAVQQPAFRAVLESIPIKLVSHLN